MKVDIGVAGKGLAGGVLGGSLVPGSGKQLQRVSTGTKEIATTMHGSGFK